MKQLATEAIILKRINYGEADRILKVLTKESGQVSMLAKGVRKAKSKLAGGLELFSISDLNYIDGKSDLKTIVSTRLKIHYKSIVSDLDRTMAGYDFMKAIDMYSQHSDDGAYFELLYGGLETLNDVNLTVGVANVWFYIKLLELNGNGINLEKPINAIKFDDTSVYEFSYEDMSFLVNKTGKFTPKHIKFLRLVSRSSAPKQLIAISGYSELSEELQAIIKQCVIMHKA